MTHRMILVLTSASFLFVGLMTGCKADPESAAAPTIIPDPVIQMGASDPISVLPEVTQTFTSLCDQSYKGRVISHDPQDADWRGKDLIIGPVLCTPEGEVEIPLAVGEDTSRTWIITRRADTLEFRHQHVLEDGALDPVSDYGGLMRLSEKTGRTWRMDFPADEKTVKIFKATGLDVSITNVWRLELTTGSSLLYQLSRENRDFRALFDLSQPL